MCTKVKKIILAVGIMLLAAMLCGFGFFQKKQDDYRTIRVYKIEGTATVEREELGSMDAYEGMLLRSGDTVQTPKESWLYFQMDEDKFALLGPESLLHIQASGTSADSKTYLSLESGSLVNRLDNKLSPDSVYEVNTPNSTMAVRGTIWGAKVRKDDAASLSEELLEFERSSGNRADELHLFDGNAIYTKLTVFTGTVESRLNTPEGGKSTKKKRLGAGETAWMRIDGTSSVYLENGEVNYKLQPIQVLEFLLTAAKEGTELPIGTDELIEYIEEAKQANHTHSGGTATCKWPAVCTGCNQPYGEWNPANHAGGTVIKGKKDATCAKTGYTGDTYCCGCDALLEKGRSIEKNASNHAGGTEIRGAVTADCVTKGYTGDTYCKGCEKILKAGKATGKDESNHTGGTEIRDAVTADCMTKGYTGDTYCSGCGQLLQSGSSTDPDLTNHIGEEVIQDDYLATCHTEGYTGNVYCNACGYRVRSGSSIPFDATNHDGDLVLERDKAANCHEEGYTGDYRCTGCNQIRFTGSVIYTDSEKHDGERVLRDVKAGTCKEKGYTGNYYCSGCNAVLESGDYTDTNPNNHVGGTFLKAESVKEATCCDPGYTGDTCCSDCGAVVKTGTAIPATGNHPAAVCGVSGHHAHDGKTHEIPACCIAGHCISDGLDHSPASCQVAGHYKCDGAAHGANCSPTEPIDAEL